MLDSRQRDELNELIKYLSTRIAWLRIGLFVSSLVQFATNGSFSHNSLTPTLLFSVDTARHAEPMSLSRCVDMRLGQAEWWADVCPCECVDHW